MRRLDVFLVIMLFVQQSLAIRYPFQWVNVPDSISDIINNKYRRYDVGAGRNVYNMLVHDDFEFENGVYSYKGMGPHFPRKLFVLNDSLYFFNTPSDNVREYMVEWLSYRKGINIEDNRMFAYSLAIIDYLLAENDIEPVVFADSILSGLSLLPNEYDYLRTEICSEPDSTAELRFTFIDENHPPVKFNIDSLYGKWYFQTIIYQKQTNIDGELLQRVHCSEMPFVYFNRNGEGYFYENGRRSSFKWEYKGSRIKIKNISKVFFNKRNPRLLTKNMFCHNNKIFIELEHGRGVTYVLSQKK